MDAKQAPNAWRLLLLLFFANLFNIFDRAIPAIVAESMRHEWSLTDFELGAVIAAFSVVFAGAAVPLGRLADTRSRTLIIGCGLIVWSTFTALGAASWNLGTFVATRMGVGIGEATCVPAASSLIGDLFPANRRSRAMGVFALGVPVGLLVAFSSVGGLVEAFGSWRAPFVVALLPGLVLAALILAIREPERGAAEPGQFVRDAAAPNPLRKVVRIRTLWWIVAAGTTSSFAAYATNSFIVPLLQRYFALPVATAGVAAGVIIGITGLVGLTLGGLIADRIYERTKRGRLLMGSVCLTFAAGATWWGLALEAGQLGQFIFVFSLGWLAQYALPVCALPAMHDVVGPPHRATAMAIYVATSSLIGGAAGPLLMGFFSDAYALRAMTEAGGGDMTEQFKAIGLHDAMRMVPAFLLATAIALLFAARSFSNDARAAAIRPS
ncbi:MFS transporter [Rhizobium sp. L18]|uniref:spinster family MFS transporter n=1 Tax=Rhizobium sp. L18 TaxID=2035451 RepID=UPI000BE87678|nr:MFS transporter [Rhizobium sp. L18]PDS87306.1 MFS transporter [Rhizobium sp. L18]